MDDAVASRQLDALTILNQEFHHTLYTLNPDQCVMPLIESVWLQLGPFQRQVIDDITTDIGIDHHKELLEALRNRDVAAVAAAVENDIRDGVVRSGRAYFRQDHKNASAA